MWSFCEQNFSGDAFSGRPMTFVYGIFSNHQPDGDGIILSQNEKWIHQRRFALKVFRDFGMGKNLMETKIEYHCNKLIELIHYDISNGVRIFKTNLFSIFYIS